jgi:glutamate carboxypeptidase
VLNRVPHAAQADLEVRAFAPTVLARADAALLALAGRTASGAQIEVTCLGRTAAWPEAAGNHGLFAAWAGAGRELDMPVAGVSRGGLSDANYLCDLGPTLDALGPVGGQAHCSARSADGSMLPEYVEPQSLIPKTVLNALALTRWLQGTR